MFKTYNSAERPVFTANHHLKRLEQAQQLPSILPPRAVILCFHTPLLRALGGWGRGRRVRGFYGQTRLLRQQQRDTLGRRRPLVLVGGFGLGAPATVALIELWHAFGVDTFISLGFVGALDPTLSAGVPLVINQALHDDGTSKHYIGEQLMSSANPALSKALANDIAAPLTTSWTTDAPFRETPSAVAWARDKGARCVEMEAAAIFAVGRALNLKTAAVGVVSDFPAEPGRTDTMNWPHVEQQLTRAGQLVIETLNQPLI